MTNPELGSWSHPHADDILLKWEKAWLVARRSWHYWRDPSTKRQRSKRRPFPTRKPPVFFFSFMSTVGVCDGWEEGKVAYPGYRHEKVIELEISRSSGDPSCGDADGDGHNGDAEEGEGLDGKVIPSHGGSMDVCAGVSLRS